MGGGGAHWSEKGKTANGTDGYVFYWFKAYPCKFWKYILLIVANLFFVCFYILLCCEIAQKLAIPYTNINQALNPSIVLILGQILM